MRALPEGLASALASGVTTLCRCWILERKDGARLGLTDHDRSLTVAGINCEAASALTASAVESSTGLSIDTHTVSGALQSEAIDEDDVVRGLYDGATLTTLIVDWAFPAESFVLGVGLVGEIRRRGRAFEAEITSLSEQLNQPIGRAFVPTCSLSLGEARCGVDLNLAAYRAGGEVMEATGQGAFTAVGLEGYPSGWFNNGIVQWQSGRNVGVTSTVRLSGLEKGNVSIELWSHAPFEVAPQDKFEITAGCGKTFATCKTKFSNVNNFRGFPHMPGDDWATGYATEGGMHDGGSLFRS